MSSFWTRYSLWHAVHVPPTSLAAAKAAFEKAWATKPGPFYELALLKELDVTWQAAGDLEMAAAYARRARRIIRAHGVRDLVIVDVEPAAEDEGGLLRSEVDREVAGRLA